jgi:transcriptional regulator with XRE-family HTH domain
MNQPYASSVFTRYFEQVVTEKGLSAAEMAVLTGFNERLIRAWRKGERLPNFQKLEMLSKVLEVSIEELKEKLFATLQNSNDLKEATPRTRATKNRAENPLATHSDHSSYENVSEELPAKIVSGKQELCKALIALVQSLGEANDPDNNKIMIAFNAKEVIFNKEYLSKWHDCLKEAIKRGWFIEHIIQMDTRDRALRAIGNILRYTVENDQYLQYKPKYKRSIDVSSGLVVVPGQAALVCYATEHPEAISSGVLMMADENKQEIEIYEKYFELLKKTSEKTSLKYANNQCQDALEEVARADQEAGDRIVLLRRLSEVTHPDYFYEKGSNWSKAIQKYYRMTEEELDRHLDTRRERHYRLRTILKTNRCKYIYYTKVLRDFIDEETCYPYYFSPSLEEKLDQLIELRRLVLAPESNGNFEFAIISEEEEKSLDLDDFKPIFCESKQGTITIMEIPMNTKDEEGNLQHQWYLIKDRTMTNSFHDYLADLWDRLKDDSKAISALAWLNQQITTLEDKLEKPRSV